MLRSTSTVTLLSGSGARTPGAPSRRANVCRLRLTVPPESLVSEQNEKKVERKEQTLFSPLSTKDKELFVLMQMMNDQERRLHHQRMQKLIGDDYVAIVEQYIVVVSKSTNQLKEEMNYIKDVRATLEEVRKRMYGDYNEMRQKIQQITQELSVSQAQQNYLENHIQTQSSALDSFNAMNSALASDSIDLQKTLVDVTLENSDIKDQIRNLQQTYEASMNKLREKQRQLEVAEVENQLLKMKVKYGSYAYSTAGLLMIRRVNAPPKFETWYQQLEEASASLRERIRHLDDMVHCQQKKVKQMVEEIESLKKKVQQKQLLILQLLEKISFLEGENNELQSRLDYLTETQPTTEVETREIGVGCDLLPSHTDRTREIAMPSRGYAPYARVLELTMKKSLT
ncbi:PREDICTED: myocardial zonula adherens protein-like [Hipposideros armiger]|uniref:Myocardial zonula adherens protein-like n=1 Tax=Hipposideros armiger TaxID=186990 RepID=A0A8B7SKB6_HIPAR|nr:PREDICTED: myocardial zonula adherens protein-like [Hipposideros armiger]